MYALSSVFLIMADPNVFDWRIVEKAQHGDEKAREDLLRALEPLLRAFFIKRVGFKSEVDDLVQNTLLRVHRGLTDLKDLSSLRAFAMKGALFELQDLYRGRYSAKESLIDPEYPLLQHDKSTTSSTHIDLERALAALSPTARRIIELREYGYRYEEIAQLVGSTEAAIKMQVKRAFEKMRDMLLSLLFALLWW